MTEPNNTPKPPPKVFIGEAPGGSFSMTPLPTESTPSPHEAKDAVPSRDSERSLGEKALDHFVKIMSLSRPDR